MREPKNKGQGISAGTVQVGLRDRKEVPAECDAQAKVEVVERVAKSFEREKERCLPGRGENECARQHNT